MAIQFRQADDSVDELLRVAKSGDVAAIETLFRRDPVLASTARLVVARIAAARVGEVSVLRTNTANQRSIAPKPPCKTPRPASALRQQQESRR